MRNEPTIYSAAVYCRLSKDDKQAGESVRIETQKMMLEDFCHERGFPVYEIYADDGISGTTFERPSFKWMIRNIEDGKIGVVLCKDLSRLGRNNALVAYYTEIFFPDNDVRFICVSENIDTGKGENEIMPFKGVVSCFQLKFYTRV